MAAVNISKKIPVKCSCIWYWHEPTSTGANRTMLVSSSCFHFWNLSAEVRKTVFDNEMVRGWANPSYQDMGLVPVNL